MAASPLFHQFIGVGSHVVREPCPAPRDRAFHAGRSQFKGRQYCNNYMVGIENIGSYGDDYTEMQYISNADLCTQLMLEHSGITTDNNVGHEDVCVPLGRKKDPGPTFDWARLRAMING